LEVQLNIERELQQDVVTLRLRAPRPGSGLVVPSPRARALGTKEQ